ncbi:16S rRNA (cytosine(1402)-N(4))-methyltransferase RsmH [Allobaculum sp. JKK-2023]|uniref:16S rRNA (cytosine(1402)-N(4))-methyltransferase RsmH n=1 Tax=Allobaculum sp. JKK-2023 TaxID=3108943 RepID=UPI002B059709|nr:16S rRNA (cytosine(1402)-N(4))-methyltransferase RsmH [Allobaculum sp. JKK-2023]
MEHISVLLDEAIDMLKIKPDGIYVDCTLGRGGHSSEILKRIPHGHLYAFDLDQSAIDESRKRLEAIGSNFTLIHAPFEEFNAKLDELGVGQVDGILMDLGVSSPQFDDPKRGFSYRYDARLDMRMDQSQDLDAQKIVNTYPKEELLRVLREYGEEPNAGRIASAIVKAREEKPIETTFELVDLIKSALPAAVLRKKGHPAKQTFQALRMEVNKELPQLTATLEQGLDRLKPGGRMAVITFHSLEDRIVKQAFANRALPKKVNRRMPVAVNETLNYRLVNRKPVTASPAELEANSRAHSAKLRGVERTDEEDEKK